MTWYRRRALGGERTNVARRCVVCAPAKFRSEGDPDVHFLWQLLCLFDADFESGPDRGAQVPLYLSVPESAVFVSHPLA